MQKWREGGEGLARTVRAYFNLITLFHDSCHFSISYFILLVTDFTKTWQNIYWEILTSIHRGTLSQYDLFKQIKSSIENLSLSAILALGRRGFALKGYALPKFI